MSGKAALVTGQPRGLRKPRTGPLRPGHPSGMVEREPIGHASATVMTGDREALVPQLRGWAASQPRDPPSAAGPVTRPSIRCARASRRITASTPSGRSGTYGSGLRRREESPVGVEHLHVAVSPVHHLGSSPRRRILGGRETTPWRRTRRHLPTAAPSVSSAESTKAQHGYGGRRRRRRAEAHLVAIPRAEPRRTLRAPMGPSTPPRRCVPQGPPDEMPSGRA
jgi:hypothetical protein